MVCLPLTQAPRALPFAADRRRRRRRHFGQVLTTCRHEHLVPLLGICVDPTPMLVYPFVGHSLEWHLREPERRAAIGWSTRLSVALAVTKGLQVGFFFTPRWCEQCLSIYSL